ncbi:MAG: hypothetical protein HFI63_01090 [Lachnospiraceae bacterium]|nr:hypothetical protein [Lachnospiraceae bacterium]
MTQKNDKTEKVVLFGSGDIGKEALELIGRKNVAFFVDNAIEDGKIVKKWDVDVFSFLEYKKVYPSYITIITANKKNECQIAEQLLKNGIKRFLFWEEIVAIFNGDWSDGTKIQDVAQERLIWRKQTLQVIKSIVPLKQDKDSEVEFYLVDSFEIVHFLPIYEALRKEGVKARFVAEPTAIHSAGRWFDYWESIHSLQEKEIEYCTLRNPEANISITTQFAENLKYYHGFKCQMTYGVAIMKEKAFQLKKEVVEKFDYIFVHGNLQKELIARWLPGFRIIDMSYPRYLNDFEKNIDKREILNELGIKTEKPVVVYYPTWDEYSSIEHYEKEINKLRERFFVISKPHHCIWRFKEKMEALQRCSDLVLDGAYDLYKISQITDCAICDAKSGVVMELAFLNPDIHMLLIYYNSDKTDFYVDLSEVAVGVETPSALGPAIGILLNEDKKIIFRKRLIDSMYSPDIQAGVGRVTQLINKLIYQN